MVKEDFLEIHDDVTLAQCFTERAQILLHEVTYDFLALIERKKPYNYQDAHTAFVKSEMVDETLDRLQEALNRLYGETKPSSEKEAEPPKDHEDMTRTERIDEIMNQICTFAGMIENFPDWLERMKHLNFVAMCLAMGCNDYNFTCKEPGQE